MVREWARSAGQLALLLALSGCERKAPGPAECLRFAESWFPPRAMVTARQAMKLDSEFDELVRRCLTEPYDRALVDCVVSGKNRDRCRVDYLRRVEAKREPGAS